MGDDHIQHVVKNRKARHEYSIEETYEAGMALQGSEVKSIREGRINIGEAHCAVDGDEMWLYNCHIAPYQQGSEHTNHRPRRDRKLLLHKHEIERLKQKVKQEGYTIIPLRVYFRNGYAKVEIGLAKGKKLHDKRQDMKERDARRRMEREIKKFNDRR